MANATAWDIFIILVLLFVIFGRRLMPGMWRGLVRAVSGAGAPAGPPAAPDAVETSGSAPPAEKPEGRPGDQS